MSEEQDFDQFIDVSEEEIQKKSREYASLLLEKQVVTTKLQMLNKFFERSIKENSQTKYLTITREKTPYIQWKKIAENLLADKCTHQEGNDIVCAYTSTKEQLKIKLREEENENRE